MTGPLVLIALVLAAVVLSQLSDLRRQAEVRSVADSVLTRRGQNTVDEVTLLVRENKHYLERYVDWAHEHRGAGERAEAVRCLRLGCDALAELAPDFLTALRRLRQLARCVSAIVDVEPVSAYAFRTWRLRGLAGAGSIGHYLLLTSRQRMRLRLELIATTFRLALRWLGRAVGRVERHDDDLAWRRVDALVADLGRSGDEAIASAHQIALALDAVGLTQPAVRGARS